MSASSSKIIKLSLELDHDDRYSTLKLTKAKDICQKSSRVETLKSKTKTDILKAKVNDKIKAKQSSITNYISKQSVDIKEIILKYKDQHSSYHTYWENDLYYDYMELFSKNDAKRIFEYLEANIEYFPDHLQQIRIFGKWLPIRRKQVAFGEEGLTYTFSGVTVPALTWDPIILTIRDLVSELVGCQFNFVLLNRYKDGTDKIGEHRDDEKDLVPKAPIASLSLGAERDFIFRHVDARQGKADIDPVTIPLTSGSLLVMRHPTNDVWYHSLPERRNVFSPRINLTFRVMVPPSATQESRRNKKKRPSADKYTN